MTDQCLKQSASAESFSCPAMPPQTAKLLLITMSQRSMWRVTLCATVNRDGGVIGGLQALHERAAAAWLPVGLSPRLRWTLFHL